MSDYGRREFCEGGGTVWNTLTEGRTEKSGDETKILKRWGQSGSRGGYHKKEGKGGGTLVPNFVLKYTVHFWVELKKIANSERKLLWQPY